MTSQKLLFVHLPRISKLYNMDLRVKEVTQKEGITITELADNRKNLSKIASHCEKSITTKIVKE